MTRGRSQTDHRSAFERALDLAENMPKRSREELQTAFLSAAAEGSEPALDMLLRSGAEIDTPDKRTGLTALHLAVGRDAVFAAELLIRAGAKFLPDNLGRMPSAIAAECEVSEDMCDLIAEAEAKAEDV